MKENEKPLEDEKVLEYFYRMLVEENLKFSDLLALYVSYLERKDKEQWQDIVEGSALVLATQGAIKNAKKRSILWAGSRESLAKRCTDFLNKHKIFGEEERK